LHAKACGRRGQRHLTQSQAARQLEAGPAIAQSAFPIRTRRQTKFIFPCLNPSFEAYVNLLQERWAVRWVGGLLGSLLLSGFRLRYHLRMDIQPAMRREEARTCPPTHSVVSGGYGKPSAASFPKRNRNLQHAAGAMHIGGLLASALSQSGIRNPAYTLFAEVGLAR
jgi:hypothetical protein